MLWRRRLGDLLVLSSALILTGVALFGMRSVLNTYRLSGHFSLVSEYSLEFPLPASSDLLTPLPESTSLAGVIEPTVGATDQPVEQYPQLTPSPSEISLQVTPASLEITETIVASTPDVDSQQPPSLTQDPYPEPIATPIPAETLPPNPTPAHSTGRIVRLVIPKLRVDRAVVPLGFRQDAQGNLDWNTDKLFATANRADVIGQTVTSLNPSEGGNIVLMGHNYNNGYYSWEGAFVNLKSLKPGDEVIVFTEGGGEYHYVVQAVKKVPWRRQNAIEAEQHFMYLGPTPSEQLTLTTCGGANIWPWQARIYAIAIPVQ